MLLRKKFLTPKPTLEDLIINFNIDELQQVDHELDQVENTNNFLRSVLLAIGINLMIVGIAYYGPSIWEYVIDTTRNAYTNAWDTVYHHIGQAAVHTPTHAEVLNRIANLNPEQQQRAYNFAQTLIAQRPR